MGCLYKITSPSGKSYIGITTFSAEERLDKHYATRGRDFALCGALRKYGKDAMVLETIAESDDWEMLCLMESEFIAGHKTKYPTGYNMTDGGEGVPTRDKYQTERMIKAANCPERIRKISKSTRERWSDPDYKERHVASLMKNHNNPEWSRKRISAVRNSLNERYKNPENRKKVSIQFRGENNRSAKLSAKEVYEIRKMASDGVTHKDIAEIYNIDKSNVSLIHRRINWKHLPETEEGISLDGY